MADAAYKPTLDDDALGPVLYTVQERPPADLDWLTPAERSTYEAFRFDKRRGDWLLGRWAAKQVLLRMEAQVEIGRFEIRSAPNGAPLPWLDGDPYPARLSLSHSNGRAFAAVMPGTAVLGCDIERIEPRSEAFVETFFTDAEQRSVASADPAFRDTLVTLIWSAKESTLKALRTGLSVDTRSVEVTTDGQPGSGWAAIRTRAVDDGEFSCQWRCVDGFVQTIVTSSLPRE